MIHLYFYVSQCYRGQENISHTDFRTSFFTKARTNLIHSKDYLYSFNKQLAIFRDLFLQSNAKLVYIGGGEVEDTRHRIHRSPLHCILHSQDFKILTPTLSKSFCFRLAKLFYTFPYINIIIMLSSMSHLMTITLNSKEP